MSAGDRVRWDERYSTGGSKEAVGPPAVFAPYAEVFPTAGTALELACGCGSAAVWLARRGLDVHGVDVSPVAISRARELAATSGVAARSRFDVVDLDDGLPAGPPADVVLCHAFRDERLDGPVLARLAPGGLLAISALSEVGSRAGRFRVRAGELTAAHPSLDVVAAGEGDGWAWLLGRRPLSSGAC